jgi:hypothetical protein
MQRDLERRVRRAEQARQLAAGQVRYVVLDRPPREGETMEELVAYAGREPLSENEWLEMCPKYTRPLH